MANATPPKLTDGADVGERWPLLQKTSARIIRAIFRGRKLIWAHDQRIVEQFALTWSQFETLIALRVAPPPHELSPSELYDWVQVTSGGLTKILDGLETKGYLRRIAAGQDRRCRPVQLTDAGMQAVEHIVGDLIVHNDRLLAEAMSAEESEELKRLLDKLMAALEARDRE